MEIFVYNPKADRETLESFNNRVLSYSRDAVAVAVNPGKMGPGLTLSVFTAEELEVPAGTPCLFASVYHIEDVNDPELEEKINEFQTKVLDLRLDDDEEGGLWPASTHTIEGEDGDAWYVLLVTFALTTIIGEDK